jgi:hypothetical protein
MNGSLHPAIDDDGLDRPTPVEEVLDALSRYAVVFALSLALVLIVARP